MFCFSMNKMNKKWLLKTASVAFIVACFDLKITGASILAWDRLDSTALNEANNVHIT